MFTAEASWYQNLGNYITLRMEGRRRRKMTVLARVPTGTMPSIRRSSKNAAKPPRNLDDQHPQNTLYIQELTVMVLPSPR
jgi:hypothetical protein